MSDTNKDSPDTLFTKLKYLFSLRLYKIYNGGPLEEVYNRNYFELFGDLVVSSMSFILNMGVRTSPLIALFMIMKGLNGREIKNISSISFVAMCFLVMRSFGRFTNPVYMHFMDVLINARNNPKSSHMEELRNYDFDFHYWPVNYIAKPTAVSSPIIKDALSRTEDPSKLIQILAYMFAHSVGLLYMYPGTLKIIEKRFDIIQGRAWLVEEFDAVRLKIATIDGNHIDAIFVDNRRSNLRRGRHLVLCCEGNAGFYEFGLMRNSVRAGYSVVGWNRPGYANSTGSPYSDQEMNAIDAVVNFVFDELGCPPEKLITYGWCIGCFDACWAAVKYRLAGMILDSPYEELMPIVLAKVPVMFHPVLVETVRSHFPQNGLGELAVQFQGRVVIVRRTIDNMFTLKSGSISSNVCNNLLIRIIELRHKAEINPESAKQLRQYVEMSEKERSQIDNPNKQIINLINYYLVDYEATHNKLLTAPEFQNIMDKFKKPYTVLHKPVMQVTGGVINTESSAAMHFGSRPEERGKQK